MTMIARRSRNGGPELGQDSFLDVVANLVAIMIILVVVVGAKTKDAVADVRREREEVKQVDEPEQVLAGSAGMDAPSDVELKEKFQSLQTEVQRTQAAFEESRRLEAMVNANNERLARMERERGVLLDLMQVVRTAWDEKKKELDATAVKNAQALTEKSMAQTQLKQLEATRTRLEKTPEPVVAVAHLPTPMAKTVFGEELHFRLKGGLISIVPVDRLVQEIKGDFQRSAVGSREGLLEAAVGPIQGYIARYEMSKSRQMMAQGGQTSMATRLELVNMIIEPLQEPYGQPLEQLLSTPENELDIELAGRNPDKTTITVWVYPDSFGEFRRLKEHLYNRGFATAARPLPMDRPISGGPQGSRSRAQ